MVHLQVLREKKIPPWTEIVLVPKTGKASMYPGLFLFTTPCRMVRPVRNLAVGKQELIGTFEQVCVNSYLHTGFLCRIEKCGI